MNDQSWTSREKMTADMQGPMDGEFKISEMFFSRTDSRGVIQAGNDVFMRISGYEWENLIGAPHKLIRHPDMPKAVFWLLWSEIKKGNPIGAYVKNRTKKGNPYWVFAVVMPVEGGYLSVRMKPTSEIFEKTQALYKQQLEREAAEGTNYTPEDSAQDLVKAITDMGFTSYGTFMATAVNAELVSKDKKMNEHDDRLEAFEGMVKSVADIFEETNLLYQDFRRIEQIPVNLRLQASRCEASGGPVSVISANYSNLARDALSFALRFTKFAQNVLDQINEGLFLMCAARLQREMVAIFEAENADESPVDHQKEVEALTACQKDYGDRARASVAVISERAKEFLADSRQMRRFVGGLDVTRVTCRIETGWLPDADDGFQEIIRRLDEFHLDVERRLKRIDELNDDIIDRSTALLTRHQRVNSAA
ncbi:MAG: PAS domain-containing protein [Mangrovicoccus sp.]